MCTLALPTALRLDFGATAASAGASLARRRGAPAACGAMARGLVQRLGAAVSSAPTRKRSRDGFDGKASVIPAPGQQLLQERMRAEVDAIRVLHRQALLLSRGAANGSKPNDGAGFSAARARPAAPMEVAAKRKKTSPLKGEPEAAQQSTKPAMKKQQRPVVQSAAPPTTKSSVAKPVDKAREKCHQEVLEMERAALPDETIYPGDLQELGIAFEYAVTRTRRQAHG